MKVIVFFSITADKMITQAVKLDDLIIIRQESSYQN